MKIEEPNLEEKMSSVAPPPFPEVLVRVTDVDRVFGNVHAVQGLSFEIMKGQVVGFIGANGAGKTTTMKMMATLDLPTKGRIEIGGVDVVQEPEKVRRMVGWMPDSYGVYANMTVVEYLDFFARAYGFKKKERKARVEEVMDFADLTLLADRPMNKLSKGMGQRLCFGRMLIPDPEFLIMDEPAAGLDPKARLEFKNLVRLLSQRGKTLFISSHILSELGEMCDTMLFIDGGKLVYHGAADTLRRGAVTDLAGSNGEKVSHLVVEVGVLGDTSKLKEWVAMSSGWTLVEEKRGSLRLAVATEDPAILSAGLRKMMLDGVDVVEFRREERRLEDAFVDMIRDKAFHAKEA